MRKSKRALATAIVFALAAAALAGCGGNKKTANTQELEQKYSDKYPIESKTVLSWWMPVTANLTVNADNMGKLEFAKELEKRTGIKVEYIHPAVGQTTEKFNLLIASGDLPDIVEYSWGSYPGGPQKAIDDKYLINHTEVINKFSPNFAGYLKKNPEVDKQVKTDAGNYYGYPLISNDIGLRTTGGIIVRQDWLEDLGMELPETIDEWYTVLKKFKEEKGASAAMSLGINHVKNGAFISAWDMIYGFYSDGNGKVKYGPAQPMYKDFLATMAKWYKEGLIDSGFAINDDKTVSANMLNGTTAVTYAGLGGGIGKWMTAKKNDPAYKLTGTKYPVLKKGDRSKFGQLSPLAQVNSVFPAITTDCKDVELAARLLDYAYSDDGSMLFNFGIEGVSYEMKDGYPTYTEKVTNNPDGLSMAAVLQRYSRAGFGGGFVQDIRYLEQYAGSPEQQSAWKNWRDTDAEKYVLPPLYISTDEQSEYAKLGSSITTYVDEMFVKFITGVEPMENFDKYIENLKKMNVDRYIQMQQNAYERYLSR